MEILENVKYDTTGETHVEEQSHLLKDYLKPIKYTLSEHDISDLKQLYKLVTTDQITAQMKDYMRKAVSILLSKDPLSNLDSLGLMLAKTF